MFPLQNYFLCLLPPPAALRPRPWLKRSRLMQALRSLVVQNTSPTLMDDCVIADEDMSVVVCSVVMWATITLISVQPLNWAWDLIGRVDLISGVGPNRLWLVYSEAKNGKADLSSQHKVYLVIFWPKSGITVLATNRKTPGGPKLLDLCIYLFLARKWSGILFFGHCPIIK